MDLDIMNKLYLELSQIATAKKVERITLRLCFRRIR